MFIAGAPDINTTTSGRVAAALFMSTFCKSVCAAPVTPEGRAEITFVPEIPIKAAKPDDDTIFFVVYYLRER